MYCRYQQRILHKIHAICDKGRRYGTDFELIYYRHLHIMSFGALETDGEMSKSGDCDFDVAVYGEFNWLCRFKFEFTAENVESLSITVTVDFKLIHSLRF